MSQRKEMTERERYLLIVLMEECGEVIQECSKALRFGIDDKHPNLGGTNRERIRGELSDVLAMIDMLIEDDLIGAADALRIYEKRNKVNGYIRTR